MSTTSAIILENKDGSAEGIYCNLDGYLSYQAPTLLDYYKTVKKVRKLISLGGIDILDAATYEEDSKASDESIKGSSWWDVANKIDHSGYVYVFRAKNNKWWFSTGEDCLIKLTRPKK